MSEKLLKKDILTLGMSISAFVVSIAMTFYNLDRNRRADNRLTAFEQIEYVQRWGDLSSRYISLYEEVAEAYRRDRPIEIDQSAEEIEAISTRLLDHLSYPVRGLPDAAKVCIVDMYWRVKILNFTTDLGRVKQSVLEGMYRRGDINREYGPYWEIPRIVERAYVPELSPLEINKRVDAAPFGQLSVDKIYGKEAYEYGTALYGDEGSPEDYAWSIFCLLNSGISAYSVLPNSADSGPVFPN